ncbi:MAG: hypothetical protein GYA22_05675 [Bacteroidales bacterium]|nr:hypothetical protein [Bacteroidales bacterium]
MKSFFYWIIALIITLAAAVYQRMTGPTYPARIQLKLGEHQYSFQLPRSHTNTENCTINLTIPDTSVHALLQYKRYPTNEEYNVVSFRREGETLVAELPSQPPAGKLEYSILLTASGQPNFSVSGGPVIIRFKGAVPPWVLIPHIFLMFFSMWISNLAGLFALNRKRPFRPAMVATMVLLFAGGLIMGPIVQKYAFGAFWTGFPFGYDLTDNKTLIAFIFWIIAWAGNRKKERRGLVVLAAVVQILVFSIPHSLLGSELKYETGKVVTGMISCYL